MKSSFRQKMQIYVIMILITFFSTASEACLTLLKMDMKSYYDVPMFQIGITSASYYASSKAFSGLCQKLSKQFGCGLFIIFVAFLSTVTFLLTSVAPFYWLILFPLSVFHGFCTCSTFQIGILMALSLIHI